MTVLEHACFAIGVTLSRIVVQRRRRRCPCESSIVDVEQVNVGEAASCRLIALRVGRHRTRELRLECEPWSAYRDLADRYTRS